MQNTGRVKKTLHRAAREALFDATIEQQIESDLPYIVMVDQAHLVMLVEQGLLDRNRAAQLLEAIWNLKDSNFSLLRGLPAPRGLFLLYEDYLIERLGAPIGGVL